MSPRFVDRVLFASAIASVAASFGEPFVELVGNAGAFGPGYHDVDHLGVAPALCTGLVVATILLVRRILGRLGRRHRDEALAFVRTAAAPSGAGNFLGVVALEFLGVRTIEAFEAVVSAPASAHAAGPFGWLGAPVLIALAIHVTIVWLALRCARALAVASLEALARFVSMLDRLVASLTRPVVPLSAVDTRPASPARPLPERSWRVHGMRAPPNLIRM